MLSFYQSHLYDRNNTQALLTPQGYLEVACKLPQICWLWFSLSTVWVLLLQEVYEIWLSKTAVGSVVFAARSLSWTLWSFACYFLISFLLLNRSIRSSFACHQWVTRDAFVKCSSNTLTLREPLLVIAWSDASNGRSWPHCSVNVPLIAPERLAEPTSH